MYFEVKEGSNGGTQNPEDLPEEDPIKSLNSVAGIDGYLGCIETIGDLKSNINTVLTNIKTKLTGTYGNDEHLYNDILAAYYTTQSYYESFCDALNTFLDGYSYPNAPDINTEVNVQFKYASPGSNGEKDEFDSLKVNIGYCNGNGYKDWINKPELNCYSNDGIIVAKENDDFHYGMNKWHIGAKFVEIYKKYF